MQSCGLHAVMHYIQTIPTMNRYTTTGIVVMKASMACKTISTSVAQPQTYKAIVQCMHTFNKPRENQSDDHTMNICSDILRDQ